MASEVDICNLALSRLGDTAEISSLTEGSAQAVHCTRFYPIARDALLEAHAWRFATRRIALAEMVAEAWGWGYVYAAPSGLLKLLAVLPAASDGGNDAQEYRMEITESGAQAIYTNLSEASARYIVRITDTTKFSPLFIDALGWLLAANLAGPILKGDAGAAEAKRCYGYFQAVLSAARVSDANQQQIWPDHTPDFIAAR